MSRWFLASRPLWVIFLLSTVFAGEAGLSFGKRDQHRELRVQRALRAGDLTPNEATQLRQSWERMRRVRQESVARERAAAMPAHREPEPEPSPAPAPAPDGAARP